MAQEGAFWVIDTSSILDVRRRVPAPSLRAVFDRLERLIADGVLVYPIQVYEELKRSFRPDSPKPDLPYAWAKRNRARATRHGIQFAKVKEVLGNPQVRAVLDYEKVGGEEADPYVLALALYLQDQGHVTVLTEETADRADKLSMLNACGLLRLVCLRMVPFLVQQGIWTPDSRA